MLMAKRVSKRLTPAQVDTTTKGRPGLLPPLGVDFETALGALLKTPPPPKGGAADKPKIRKRKPATRRKT